MEYSINPGIYYMYHDDLDYHCVVEKPDVQFQNFLRSVETEGAKKGS